MNVLALDTSLGACSAAVASKREGAPELFRVHEPREREHAEAIMGMAERVMGEAGLAYGDLDAIAVTVGPGSFTGVRVGISAARGLALATGKPLIGATSLEVMARQALETLAPPPGRLAVAADARRGEVYVALFDNSGETLGEPVALAPSDAAGLLMKSGVKVIAGGGAALVADAAARSGWELGAILPDLQPDAGALALLALTRAPHEGPLAPLYLRPPDAKPQSGKAVARR